MSAVPAAPTETPVEAAPDEELPQDEEIVQEEAADVEEEAEDDADALLQAIEELGEDDPLVQKLKEKLGPAPFDEREAQWEDERDQAEVRNLALAARAQAAQFEGQAIRERAAMAAYEMTSAWGQGLAEQAKRIADGDYDPANGVFDDAAAAQSLAEVIAQQVEQALPAARGEAAVRILDSYLASMRQSDIHRLLTKDDRQKIADAKKLPYVDHRIARINAIYLNRAIEGRDALVEGKTKAQQAAEETKNAARATLLKAVGRSVPSGTAGTRYSRAKEDELLADPATPMKLVDEILARRSKAG